MIHIQHKQARLHQPPLFSLARLPRARSTLAGDTHIDPFANTDTVESQHTFLELEDGNLTAGGFGSNGQDILERFPDDIRQVVHRVYYRSQSEPS